MIGTDVIQSRYAAIRLCTKLNRFIRKYRTRRKRSVERR